MVLGYKAPLRIELRGKRLPRGALLRVGPGENAPTCEGWERGAYIKDT